jgi:hypothetical protein
LPATPQSHRAARRLRHRQAHQATLCIPPRRICRRRDAAKGDRRGGDRPGQDVLAGPGSPAIIACLAATGL